MVRVPACLLFLALAASAQDNAAAKALKEKIDRMNFLQLATRPKLIARAAPRVCSIPLFNVLPNPNTERMPMLNPPAAPTSRERQLPLPAPPCR